MFAISDDVTSQQYGVVCFGQDVAASADTVAVMVSQKYCWTNIAIILVLSHFMASTNNIITSAFCLG